VPIPQGHATHPSELQGLQELCQAWPTILAATASPSLRRACRARPASTAGRRLWGIGIPWVQMRCILYIGRPNEQTWCIRQGLYCNLNRLGDIEGNQLVIHATPDYIRQVRDPSKASDLIHTPRSLIKHPNPSPHCKPPDIKAIQPTANRM
jgi:hypothetical protein